MAEVPYRILCLSGGGVRGIFQAVFLAKLEEKYQTPIREQFDLISGTSTGSIVALALALGIDLGRVIDFYEEKSGVIFKKSPLGFFDGFKKGSVYDQQVLREALSRPFKGCQLRDAKTHVLVTASNSDNYSSKVFSSIPVSGSDDERLSVVDVALASCAAPTYFPPVTPEGSARTYFDGGLWANDPSLVSVLFAHSKLNIPIRNMRVLSVGTGDSPSGIFSDSIRNFKKYSVSTIKTIFDLILQTQENASAIYTAAIVSEECYMRVSHPLDNRIELDDSAKANEILKPLAENKADELYEKIKCLLTLAPPLAADLQPVEAKYNPELPVDAISLSLNQANMGLKELVTDALHFKPDYIFGINRGGAIVGGFIAKRLKIPYVYILNVNCDMPAGRRVLEQRQDGGEISGRVLLVDDAKRKGEHMREAWEYLSSTYTNLQIRRLVLLELRGLTHHGPEKQTFAAPLIERSAFHTFNSKTSLPWDDVG